MNTARKKELKAAYQTRRPEMGVICFRWAQEGPAFLGASSDVKRDYNSSQFKLAMGNHPNKAMQALWDRHGQEGLTFSVLEKLDYDDPAEDHSQALELLREVWLEKDPAAQKIWK